MSSIETQDGTRGGLVWGRRALRLDAIDLQPEARQDFAIEAVTLTHSVLLINEWCVQLRPSILQQGLHKKQ